MHWLKKEQEMRQGEAGVKIEIGNHFDLPNRLNSKELCIKFNIMRHQQRGDHSVL